MIKTEALYVFSDPITRSKNKYLAVAVQEFRPGVLAFSDTVRGHTVEGKITSDDEGNVRVEDKRGVWEFTPCTLDMFRRKYKNTVANGDDIAEVCETTDDLWEWYRRHFGGNNINFC
jgi:hypothetical protein